MGSKIFLLLGLVMTIVVLLTSTKVAARDLAEASTVTRKAEATAEATEAVRETSLSRSSLTKPGPCYYGPGCP